MSDPAAPTSPWPSWVAAWLAGAAVLLVVVNCGLELMDAAARADVGRRQAFIAQTAEIGRIDNALIRALALQAAGHHDAKIAALLKRAGITYQLHPAPAAAKP